MELAVWIMPELGSSHRYDAFLSNGISGSGLCRDLPHIANDCADRGSLVSGVRGEQRPLLVTEIDHAALLSSHAVHGTRFTVHA